MILVSDPVTSEVVFTMFTVLHLHAFMFALINYTQNVQFCEF